MPPDEYWFYSRIYDRLLERAARRLRNECLKVYPPRENLAILDVGCGTGTQLALYSRPGCRLAGIDQSPSMLAVAQRKLGGAADLRLEDASRMAFASDTFDLVMMTLALHEMPPGMRLAVLREGARVVKPDGRIMLADFHGGPYTFPEGWMLKTFITMGELGAGQRHYKNYRDFLRRGGLERLAVDAGLTVDVRCIAESGVAAVYLLRR